MSRITIAASAIAWLAFGPVSAETVFPEAVSRVAPAYPSAADTIGLKGTVQARVSVDEQGAVTAVDVLDEQPTGFDFASAAVTALQQWTFKPGRAGRKIVTINFQPPDGGGRDVQDFAEAPRPVKRVTPRYPSKAEARGAQGEANLILTIDATGTPSDIRIAGELPEDFDFGKAALKAARQWRFEPGQAGVFVLTVRFMMSGEKPGINWYDLKKAPDPSHRVGPIVPPQALADDRMGRVKLAFATDSTGRVTTVRIVEERPDGYGFGDAAKAAVGQWRFEGSPDRVYRLQMTITPP